MSSPLPMILCGKLPPIIAATNAGLLPEFEVIHVCQSTAAGVADIPLLLRGETPPARDQPNLGSRNYAQTPVAVCLGAAFTDDNVAEMRAACNGKAVPWLRPDPSKPRPPLGPGYGEALVKNVKDLWKELTEAGKTDVDGVHYF